MINLTSFYENVKNSFIDLSEKADKHYDDYWNTIVEMEFSEYSWFESLANALNREMLTGVDSGIYKPLFEIIRHSYLSGNEEVKRAIAVAFVENLFWQVPINKAKPYWRVFPDLLKGLYVDFHQQTPI